MNAKNEIVILPSLKTNKVKQIITPDIKNLNVPDKNEKVQSTKMLVSKCYNFNFRR
ncbi:TPA: hypothetical protein ACHDTU_001759 [Campylobacter jejuni]